jgi:CheY-like chemotaxis protein
MTRPRVLLVEDDTSIRRFVVMALEDSEIVMVEAETLRAANQALHGPPFALVLCDLMLPDGSGLDLLQSLGEPDSPSPKARRIAFSAGVSGEVRQRLAAIGVTEILSKPISVAALIACVEGAVQAADAGAAAGADVATAVDPVMTYFGGDRELFDSFSARCRAQWPRDAALGDLAARQGDLPALRRLAHSSKSVLLTLGLAADSALAFSIEKAAAEQRADTAWALWPRLRGRLLALAAGGPPPRP